MTCKNDYVIGADSSNELFNELIKNVDTFDDNIRYTNDSLTRIDISKASKMTSQFNQLMFKARINKYVLVKYNFISQRLKLGPINIGEITAFVDDGLYDIDDIIEQLDLDITSPVPIVSDVSIDVVPVTPATDEIFKNYDSYLNDNVSNVISGDFCSTFGNIFSKIESIDTFISSSALTISALSNIDFSAKAVLNEFVDKANTIIDTMADQYLDHAKRYMDSLGNIENLPQQVLSIGLSHLNQNNEFYTPENIETIKKKIEAMVAGMSGQFEELTPETLSLLMFRLCQFVDTVQTFMETPKNEFRTFVETSDTTMKTVDTAYSIERHATTAMGGSGTVISPEVIKTQKAKAYSNLSNGVAQPSRSGGLTSPSKPVIQPPQNEFFIRANTFNTQRNSSGRFTSVSNEFFTLTQRAMNVGVDYNSNGRYAKTCGWSEIRPDVFGYAALLSQRMGRRLTVSSAYRSPQKNAAVGGKTKSFHMAGVALDILIEGMDTAEFVKQASMLGFTGIGYYNTFIHIDRRQSLAMWVSGSPNRSTQRNLNIHRNPSANGYFKDA